MDRITNACSPGRLTRSQPNMPVCTSQEYSLGKLNMSRSKRKTPIVAMTSHESDKPFKKAEHQRERAQAKVTLRTTVDDTALSSHKAFKDPGKSLKDGKQYVGKVRPMNERDLHKLTSK